MTGVPSGETASRISEAAGVGMKWGEKIPSLAISNGKPREERG